MSSTSFSTIHLRHQSPPSHDIPHQISGTHPRLPASDSGTRNLASYSRHPASDYHPAITSSPETNPDHSIALPTSSITSRIQPQLRVPPPPQSFANVHNKPQTGRSRGITTLHLCKDLRPISGKIPHLQNLTYTHICNTLFIKRITKRPYVRFVPKRCFCPVFGKPNAHWIF